MTIRRWTVKRQTDGTDSRGEGLRRIFALLGLACALLVIGAAVGLVLYGVGR